MKILRVAMNITLCFIMIVLLSLTQIGLFDLMAVQSDRVDGIHISNGDDDVVGYFDSYEFWATDISTGLKVGAKYRVRNFFAWRWWKNSTKWIDVTLDAVIASVKPIFTPIAQVNAIADYYGKSIDDFYSELLHEYESEDELKAALYEVYVIYGKGYGAIPSILEGYEYPSDKIEKTDSVIASVGKDTAYARWVRNNKNLYNTIWKLTKYNHNDGETYAKYYNKFLVKYENGSISIKPAVMVLYYLNFLSIVLAVVFVIKYPIGLFQAKISYHRHPKDDD